MGVYNFKDLMGHVGHKIVVVTYGDPVVNVACECEDCCAVLVDFDKDESEEKVLDLYQGRVRRRIK